MAIKLCKHCMTDVFYEKITDMETCPHCGTRFPDFPDNKESPLFYSMAVFGFLFWNLFILNLYGIMFQKFGDVFEKHGLVEVKKLAQTGLSGDGFSFLTSPAGSVALVISLVVFATLCIGLLLEITPERFRRIDWMKPTLIGNLALFVLAVVAIPFFGVQDAIAATAAATDAVGIKDISIGMGLAIMGAGLPTGFSTIAAGLAVGPIGSASLAALAEKPEMFGRTLVYLGLAEGIAIYGLVMSILLLDRI